MAGSQSGWYAANCAGSGIFLPEACVSTLNSLSAGSTAGAAQGVKQEKLDWLADNPFYTKRFAFYVGRRCRKPRSRMWAKEGTSIGERSRRWRCNTCEEQIKRAGQPGPKVIGIDEISTERATRTVSL